MAAGAYTRVQEGEMKEGVPAPGWQERRSKFLQMQLQTLDKDRSPYIHALVLRGKASGWWKALGLPLGLIPLYVSLSSSVVEYQVYESQKQPERLDRRPKALSTTLLAQESL